MLYKYSAPNKFGCSTWLIEISNELSILINETNNSYLIEMQEKGFFKRKTFASFNTTLDFEGMLKLAFDKLYEELLRNPKYKWGEQQKKNKLNQTLNLYNEKYATKSKINMSHFDSSSSEYWLLESFQALQKGENENARVFAEKAVELDSLNMDANFLYLTTLIKRIENTSFHKLKTNLDKANNIAKMLRQRKRDGELTSRQEQKLYELQEELHNFWEYVESKRLDSENERFLI